MTTGVIVDLVIVGIFLIAIIIGLVKGFNNLFMGFLSELGGLLVAGALCVVVANKLIAIPKIASLASVFAGWFKSANLTMEIESLEALTTLLSTGVLSVLSGKADAIWGKMQQYSVNTLAGYLGNVLLKVFASALCFIVILLVVRLLLNGLRALIQKLNKHTAFKVINMIFGVVWTVTATYLIVVVICLTGAELVVAKWFETSLPSLQAALADSALLKLLHNSNIIGQYISQALGIALPDLFPLAP